MKTILLIDSCCDIPLSFIEENNDIVDFISMPINIEGNEYYDDFGKTLTHDKFYKYLENGIVPSTAQINSYMFYENFKKHCNQGKSIIYLALSSGLSGTYNNAINAKEMLIKENNQVDITIIDSKSASIGQGILALHAVEMIRNGYSKNEIVQWIESNKLKSNHWFAVNDLTHLKKGGRISAASATIGTLLNVKPILIVNWDGKLKLYTNARGRKKSLKFLIDKFKEHTKNQKNVTVIIGHGHCLKDAQIIKEKISKESNVKKIIITELNATIASHVGAGMIAVAFIGDVRENIE